MEQTLTLFQVRWYCSLGGWCNTSCSAAAQATHLRHFLCHPLLHVPLLARQDLAAGYMSGKLLLKLDAIAFLLTHHTSGGQPLHYCCVGACACLPAATCLLTQHLQHPLCAA